MELVDINFLKHLLEQVFLVFRASMLNVLLHMGHTLSSNLVFRDCECSWLYLFNVCEIFLTFTNDCEYLRAQLLLQHFLYRLCVVEINFDLQNKHSRSILEWVFR